MFLDLIENSPAFPVLPEEIKHLLQMVQSEHRLDVGAVAKAIEKNKQLSNSILAMVNSPIFGSKKTVTSVREGVMMLGFATVRNVIVFYTIRLFFPTKALPGQKFDIAKFWKHLLATAIAAEIIGEKVHGENLFRLFTYGLIHDIGIVVMDACIPDKMDEIQAKVLSGVPFLVAERASLAGLAHTTIGAWVCRKWGLGEDLTYIVEFHHTPLMSPVLSEDLCIIHAADLLGARQYETILESSFGDMQMQKKVLERLGMDISKLLSFEKDIPLIMDEYIKRYGDKF